MQHGTCEPKLGVPGICCAEAWLKRLNLLHGDVLQSSQAADSAVSARGLTFDVRGGRKWAKPACGRPLDGGVRQLVDGELCLHLTLSASRPLATEE
jgi:hypothetical protein